MKRCFLLLIMAVTFACGAANTITLNAGEQKIFQLIEKDLVAFRKALKAYHDGTTSAVPVFNAAAVVNDNCEIINIQTGLDFIALHDIKHRQGNAYKEFEYRNFFINGVYYGVQCPECYGSGTCKMCGGTGIALHNNAPCGTCSGPKSLCLICNREMKIPLKGKDGKTRFVHFFFKGKRANLKKIETDYEKFYKQLMNTNVKGLVKQCDMLGSFYLEGGRGVGRNPKRARELLKFATEHGSAHAAYMYSKCLQNGLGGPTDWDKAREYFELAANKNCLEAMRDYVNRKMEYKDYNDLFKWADRIYKYDHGDGLYYMGVATEFSPTGSLFHALVYYKLGAQANSDLAMQRLMQGPGRAVLKREERVFKFKSDSLNTSFIAVFSESPSAFLWDIPPIGPGKLGGGGRDWKIIPVMTLKEREMIWSFCGRSMTRFYINDYVYWQLASSSTYTYWPRKLQYINIKQAPATAGLPEFKKNALDITKWDDNTWILLEQLIDDMKKSEKHVLSLHSDTPKQWLDFYVHYFQKRTENKKNFLNYLKGLWPDITFHYIDYANDEKFHEFTHDYDWLRRKPTGLLEAEDHTINIWTDGLVIRGVFRKLNPENGKIIPESKLVMEAAFKLDENEVDKEPKWHGDVQAFKKKIDAALGIAPAEEEKAGGEKTEGENAGGEKDGGAAPDAPAAP